MAAQMLDVAYACGLQPRLTADVAFTELAIRREPKYNEPEH